MKASARTGARIRPVGAGRLVFVYGTLLPGESRWPALRALSESWHHATAPGELWDTGRGYPAARFVPGDKVIPGVVVAVQAPCWEDALDRLDEIEGEGELYRRVEV